MRVCHSPLPVVVLALAAASFAACGGGANSAGGAGGSVPSGTIVAFAGPALPPGWTLCDGGTTPTGLTTPDLRGRFLRGAQGPGTALTAGGSESHTHSLGAATVRVGADTDNDAAVAGASHGHELGGGDHLPPYVAVAYIMKD